MWNILKESSLSHIHTLGSIIFNLTQNASIKISFFSVTKVISGLSKWNILYISAFVVGVSLTLKQKFVLVFLQSVHYKEDTN